MSDATEPARPRLTSRNDGLDLLRAAGAALVFLGHLYHNYGLTWLGPVAEGGRLGIYIFFPLSGYLLSRPFYEGRVDLRRYGIARAARILPAYYLALLGLALLGQAPVNPATLTLTGNMFALDAIQRSGFGQSWTLGVEVLFYLLLPAFALLRGRWLMVAVAGTWLLGVQMFDGFQRFQLTASLWAFGFGMVVGQYRGSVPTTVAPVGLALLLFGVIDGSIFGAGCVALGTAVLIAWAARARPAASWARWPADLSYSVYLWHLGVMAVVARFVNGPMLAVAAIAVTIGIAWLSFRYIERPVLRHLSHARPQTVSMIPAIST